MANKMRDNLPDTDLVRARLAIVNARRDFDAEVEKLWADRSAALRTRLEQMVWKMRHEEGRSVTYICEQYGTKDRNTIYNLLARAEQVWGVPAVDPEPPTTDDAPNYTLSDLDDLTWLVTDSRDGRTVEVSKATRKTGATNGDLGPAMRRDPNHEAWKVVPNA